MTSIYKNKMEALQGLRRETETCKRYMKASRKKVKEGKIGAAISLLDIAQIAKTCAEDAHEALWSLSKGNLKDEEFESFCESETLGMEINKVCREIRAARK